MLTRGSSVSSQISLIMCAPTCSDIPIYITVSELPQTVQWILINAVMDRSRRFNYKKFSHHISNGKMVNLCPSKNDWLQVFIA